MGLLDLLLVLLELLVAVLLLLILLLVVLLLLLVMRLVLLGPEGGRPLRPRRDANDAPLHHAWLLLMRLLIVGGLLRGHMSRGGYKGRRTEDEYLPLTDEGLLPFERDDDALGDNGPRHSHLALRGCKLDDSCEGRLHEG